MPNAASPGACVPSQCGPYCAGRTIGATSANPHLSAALTFVAYGAGHDRSLRDDLVRPLVGALRQLDESVRPRLGGYVHEIGGSSPSTVAVVSSIAHQQQVSRRMANSAR